MGMASRHAAAGARRYPRPHRQRHRRAAAGGAAAALDEGQRVNLAILGATGSIGSSTLDVVARHRERYRVFALSAHRSAHALLALCGAHRPSYAVLSGVTRDAELAAAFKQCGTELLFGDAALEQVASDARCDIVIWLRVCPSVLRPQPST